MSAARDLFRRLGNRNGQRRGEPVEPVELPALPTETMVVAAHRINAELDRRTDQPLQLGANARECLALLHAEYLADLGQEAVRIARRSHVTTVDETHVRQASVRLGMGRVRTSALEASANTFGGVFAGAGIASVYAIMFTPGPHTTGETAVALALSVLGFVSLAVGLTLTFLRRSS